MNKTILSFMCVGLCAMACAETAFEGQPIGTIAVTSPNKSLIVSVAFNELAPKDGTEITAANLISTKNLTDGDTIHVFDNGQYATWTKSGNSWTSPQKSYSLSKDGSQSDGNGVDASTVGSSIGEGFWLIRTGEDLTQPFYIYGAYVKPSTTEAKAGVKSLMGNPLSTPKAPTITGAAEGDMISVMTKTAAMGEILKVYRYDNGAWMGRNDKNEYVSFSPPPTLAGGLGFWYTSTGSSPVTFKWD